jgi:phage terminase large subunit-like protein
MHWSYSILHHHSFFFLFTKQPSLLFSILFLFLFLFITITVFTTPQVAYSLYFGDTINIIESNKSFLLSSPEVAATESGNVYVVWVDKNTLYFKSSHDNGSKFNTSIILSKNVNLTSLSPEVAATESGNVYVVWVDKKNNSTYGGDTDIAFKWSKDAGQTFKSKKLSRGLSASSLSPQLAATESGNVYVVWSNNQTNFKEILGNNAIFGETIKISNNTDSAYPQLAATEDGNVYILWVANKHNTDTEKVLYFKRISNFLFD